MSCTDFIEGKGQRARWERGKHETQAVQASVYRCAWYWRDGGRGASIRDYACEVVLWVHRYMPFTKALVVAQ